MHIAYASTQYNDGATLLSKTELLSATCVTLSRITIICTRITFTVLSLSDELERFANFYACVNGRHPQRSSDLCAKYVCNTEEMKQVLYGTYLTKSITAVDECCNSENEANRLADGNQEVGMPSAILELQAYSNSLADRHKARTPRLFEVR